MPSPRKSIKRYVASEMVDVLERDRAIHCISVLREQHFPQAGY